MKIATLTLECDGRRYEASFSCEGEPLKQLSEAVQVVAKEVLDLNVKVGIK